MNPVGICLALALGTTPALADDISVFAAASLGNALDVVAAGYEAETGNRLVIAYAGSSVLAQQIRQGAPADIFISANSDWMDFLASEGLIADQTRRDLLGNSLVLIAQGAASPVEISPDLDLAGLLGNGRLAMALVDAVPAGIYGKAALSSLGLWDTVAPRVAQTDNVRAALALVALGEAPFGIVYATDAAASPDVTVIGTFPPDSHPPIVYPVAALKGRDTALTLDALAYLQGASASAAFAREGFALPGTE